MPTPPALTSDQRRQAYEKSLELRRLRADLKLWLRENLPTERFQLAWDFPIAKGMKVYDLLVSLPGIGDTRARALLNAAKIPTHNTVRACGPKQRERLFALLNN